MERDDLMFTLKMTALAVVALFAYIVFGLFQDGAAADVYAWLVARLALR